MLSLTVWSYDPADIITHPWFLGFFKQDRLYILYSYPFAFSANTTVSILYNIDNQHALYYMITV